jgi:hypothetical protein
LAVAISWSVRKSILWAIFHGFLGWFYVIYYAVTEKFSGLTKMLPNIHLP